MLKRKINLRTGMVLLVVLTLAPVAVLLAIQSVAAHRNNVAKALHDTTELGLKLVSYPKEVLPEPRRFLINISRLPEMASAENCDALRAVLKPAIRVQPYFTTITIFSPSGRRICPQPQQGENINLLDRDYFQRVLQQKTYTISRLLIGRLSKTESIMFSLPILDERSEIRYIINLGLDAKWLQTLLDEAVDRYQVPSGTISEVVDDAGVLVAATPATYGKMGQKIPDWDSVHALLGKSEEVARLELWRDGVERITVYLPLFSSSNASLRLRVGTPIQPAKASAVKKDALFLAIVASVLFLTISLAWWASTRMVLRPIRAVWTAATSLRQGNLSVRVGNIEAASELEELASVFDGMANQIQEEQQRLQFLAMHDPLTSLPNRYWIREHLSQLIQRVEETKSDVGLILLDLDGFKHINDSYGHPLGDKVLMQVAVALSACVGDQGTTGRLGGDEFVIILEGGKTPDDFRRLAQKVQRVFRAPIVVGEQQFFIAASMGIAMFPDHGTDMDTMIQNADVAMYRAKTEKLPGYCFYSAEMNEFSSEKLQMQNLLREAVPKGELVLFYQPKIDAVSGKITGAEALVRWQNDELGFVSPCEFIPLAEETGLIVQIGEWVLRTACARLKAWNNEVDRKLSMAINLSPRQFADPDLITKIISVAESSGIPISQLEFEITEGALMYDPPKAVEALHQIRRLGAKVAIDDFGTGYSSLAYLKNLPIDALKIDKSFVSGLPEGGPDRAIISAVVAIAQELNLRVTAEGVETAEQRDMLRTLGCEEMQGYLFARPLPATDFFSTLCQHDMHWQSVAQNPSI